MPQKINNSIISSLHQTVKKVHPRQISHAKSYDDLLILNYQLIPSQVKTLLNNDKSLKLIKSLTSRDNIDNQKNIFNSNNENMNKEQQQMNKDKQYYLPKHNKKHKQKQKQIVSQLLSQSIRKQQILTSRRLFDPFKYFGSSAHILNIQQSTRHHQSKLQLMFSQSNNSPINSQHSLSYQKNKQNRNSSLINKNVNNIQNDNIKNTMNNCNILSYNNKKSSQVLISPKNSMDSVQNIKKQQKKITLDVKRISNSVILQKLQKLKQHQKKIKLFNQSINNNTMNNLHYNSNNDITQSHNNTRPNNNNKNIQRSLFHSQDKQNYPINHNQINTLKSSYMKIQFQDQNQQNQSMSKFIQIKKCQTYRELSQGENKKSSVSIPSNNNITFMNYHHQNNNNKNYLNFNSSNNVKHSITNNNNSKNVKQSLKPRPTPYHYHHKIHQKNDQNSFSLSNRMNDYKYISTQKKNSINNTKNTKVNCSPKSYVKQSKQNYIKMNINNLQKVRLKLKLNSKVN